MKRKIYNKLLDWKTQWNGKSAVLVDGARRIGKSWIVEEFAKNEYKSYILIDFNNVAKPITDLFENYLSNLDVFFQRLSLLTGVRLYERDSVIVFDEVQQFPRARAAIKYLVKDGRYDYIETGSLVSINRNVKGIVIPSEEERIDMFPMDFEEFLWAMGDDMLMPFVKDCFEKRQPLGTDLHRKVMELFRQYMIVGGMPQAIQEYVESRDFVKVDRIKRSILKLYRSDISKYAFGAEQKVTKIFDKIPSQLQRHEKRFRIGDVAKGARMRDYVAPLFWLEESRVVNICYASTEPSIGLNLNRDEAKLKMYFADTGLLISLAFNERDIQNEQIYRKLMFDKLEINKGMLVENMVAQMLRAAGNELYFYSHYSREAAERMEVDFLIRKSTVTSRHNILPIEVKSSTGYGLTSLKKCIAKFGQQLATPCVLHKSDLKFEDGILFLPLYMTPFL